tara:strand:- start:180 stop:632 length:453 start_codon:yes stop_codon:yes gene_type:complete
MKIKDKVWKLLVKDPLMPNRIVADKVGCSINYVSKLRQSVGTPKEVFQKEEADKMFNRSEILKTANKYVSEKRAEEHGDILQNSMKISALWNAHLGLNGYISPQDVPLMLGLIKLARISENPNNIDNYVDWCGYGALAGEVSLYVDGKKR